MIHNNTYITEFESKGKLWDGPNIEAKSWGKITEDATSQTVYGDATINLPLIVAAVLERLEK